MTCLLVKASGREGKEDDKPCVTSMKTIPFGKILHQTSSPFKQISSQKTRKTPMLREDTTKQSSNRPVPLVSHKRFDVFLLFLPSCCVSSIFIITSATPSVLNVKKRISRAHFLFQSAVAWVRHVICAAQFWTGFYWSWEGFFASARDAPWFVVIVVYTVSSDGVNISSDVPLYVILGAANFLARRIC